MDIFSEIDEDVRRDRAAQIWHRYYRLIIALAVTILLALAGWSVIERTQTRRSHKLIANYDIAMTLFREGKTEEGIGWLSHISRRAPTSRIGLLARFRMAAENAKSDLQTGVGAYDKLSSDTSVPDTWRDLARIRAASLLTDDITLEAMRTRVQSLATPSHPWRNSARELIGLAALKEGNMEEAGRQFDQMTIDRDATPAMRSRAEVYISLVKAGLPPSQPKPAS